MKEKQKMQFQMFRKVMDTMDHHVSAWIDVTELSLTNDKFARLFKKLSDLVEEEAHLAEPPENLKVENRQRLEKELNPLLGAVKLYAKDTKNKKLQKQLTVKPGALKKSKDKALINVALIISKTALQPGKKGTKAPTSLAQYGITEEMARSLNNAAVEFAELKTRKEKTRKKRKQLHKKETKLTGKISGLLKNRMDRLVNIFEAKDPSFHKDYLAARVVDQPVHVNAGSTKASKAKPVQQKPGATKITQSKPVGKKASKAGTATNNPAGEIPGKAQAVQKKQIEKGTQQGLRSAEADPVNDD